ncbi:MAG: hypothetical protein ACFFD4_14765 [Candidatus Odinarchaeota archaeon]
MAGLAHLGIGLAAKLIAPEVPVIILIICSYLIDIIFFVFMFAGMEEMPKPDRTTEAPWSHSLLMSIVWSGLAMVAAALFGYSFQTSLIIGLLVFSHWVIDFIVSPMTYAFPNDTGKPIHPFRGSPKVGLGLMRTRVGVIAIEGGFVVLGAGTYLLTLL